MDDLLPPELALDDDPGPLSTADLDNGWVDDDERAEWAMRVLVGAQTRIIDATLQRDRWIARITRWYDDTTAADRNRVGHLTGILERYAIAVRERDGRKSVKLPSGDIETRCPTEPRVEITDPKAVLVWAKDTDAACVKTVEEVLVSQLRPLVKIVPLTDDGDWGVFDADGNFVPGVAIVDPETTATVKPRA